MRKVATTMSKSIGRRFAGVFVSLILLGLSVESAYAQCGSLGAPSTTAVSGGGDFNTATTWSAGAPTSGTNACITASAGNPVTLATSQTGNVLSLQLASNNTLTLNTNTQLNVFGPQIINAGAINLSSGAGSTTLLLETTSVALSGGGTMTLSGNANGATIIEQNGGTTLTNSSTIQGNGTIGDSDMKLSNSGTVDANVSLKTLVLAGSGGVTNTGLLEGTNGGTLALSNTITNAGGNITASGGTVTLGNGTVINGGTLNSVSGGTLQTTPFNTAALNGVTISTGTTYLNTNGSQLNVSGTITNNGVIQLNDTGSGSLMFLTGNLTLNGTGTVTLVQTGGGIAQIIEQNGATILTNSSTSTIQGVGRVGDSDMKLVNNGTVSANVSGGTLEILGTGGTTNTGLLEGTGGGTLQIDNTVTNATGNITADGGTVTLANGAVINGGTLNSLNGGTLQTASFNTAALNGVTISTGTTYVNGNGSQLNVSGIITNNGVIQVNDTGSSSVMELTGNLTLNGTGTVTLSQTGGGIAEIIEQNGATTLTNSSTSTIQGAGTVGDSDMKLVNNGTVNANVSGGTLTLTGTGGITNTGLLEASNGGVLPIFSTTVTNAGGNITANGGTVEISNSGVINGGTLNSLNGGLLETTPGNTATLNNVTISTGTTYVNGNSSQLNVSGTLTNNGVIQLNNTGSSSIMELTSDVTLNGTGTVTLSTSGGSIAEIIEQNSATTLTNSSTSTIQGAGQVGDSDMKLVNAGTVNANVSGGTLTLTGTGGITNTGLLEASNGGVLPIFSTTITNAGGNITANGGTVEISNSGVINGGTLNSLNGGLLETTPGNTATLNGVTISSGSTYVNGNSTQLNISGTITNNGVIQLTDTGSSSTMLLTSNVTLNGTGTVTLSQTGGGVAQIVELGSATTLTNASNTIQGAGTVGDSDMRLTNGGLIDANVNSQTLSLIGTGNLTNTGTLEAAGGGHLLASSPLASSTFSSNTLTGNYIVDGSGGNLSNLQLNGLGSSGGEIHTLGDGSTPSSITLNGANAKTLFTDSTGVNNALALSAVTANATLSLQGGYGMTTPGDLANAGTVNVGASSALTVGPSHANNYSQSAGQTNVTGTLTSTNYGMNGGNTSVLNGGNLNATGAYTQTAGTTSVLGTLTSPTVSINAGTLDGTGTVTGTTTIATGATLLPGTSTSLPGTIAFNGATTPLTLNTGSTLSEVINGTGAGQFGVTNVTGGLSVSATGILNLTESTAVQNGVIPVGTTLTIMTSTTGVTGGFTNADLTGNTTFDTGLEKWTVSKVGNNEVLLANAVGPITATWTGQVVAPDNWTTNNAGTTNWNCSIAVLGGCMPNNNSPVAGTLYNAVLNFGGSGGNTLTLGSSDSPTNITINGLNIQAGTLDVNRTGVPAVSLTVTGTTTNSDTMQAEGGATITLATNNLTNLASGTLTGGTYEPGGPSGAGTIDIGGAVTTLAAKVFLDHAGSTLANGGPSALANLASITGTGQLTVFDGATLAITPAGGTLTNSGPNLTSSFGGSTLAVTGNLTNTNAGTVTVNGNFGGASMSVSANLINQNSNSNVSLVNGGVLTVTGNATNQSQATIIDTGGSMTVSGNFTNQTLAGVTVSGGGSLSVQGATGLTNSSNITVGAITDPAGTSSLSVTNAFNNSGNLTLITHTGTSTSTVTAGTFTNTGNVSIGAGATLHAGSYTQNAGGTTFVAGTLDPPNTISINGGLLDGSGGTIQGITTIGVSGTLLPGTATNVSGTLTFTNNLTINGTLDEVINSGTQGTGYGFLNDAGQTLTIDAGAILDLLQANAYQPIAGTTLIMANYGTLVGTFTAANIQHDTFTGLSGTEQWNVVNDTTNHQLDLVAANVSSGTTTENATWSNATGIWTDPTRWVCSPTLTPCEPNNGTPANTVYNSTLSSAGQTLTLNSSATINSLTMTAGLLNIAAGGTLNLVSQPNGILDINANSGLTLGGTFEIGGNSSASGIGKLASVEGSLTLANAQTTSVTPTGGTLTVSSTGEIYLQNGSTLTVTGDLSNSGTVQMGASVANFLNVSGTFTNASGAHLSLNDIGDIATLGALSNAGTVTIAAGATLNDSLNNSGLIDVTGAQNVLGAFTNTNTGTINVHSGGVMTLDESATAPLTIVAATNAGNINVQSGGTFNLKDGGTNGDTVSFSGGGTFTLTGTGSITSPDTDMTLTNGNNLITGTGSISNLRIINDGTITPSGGTLTLSPNTLGFTNDGTVNIIGNTNTLAVTGAGNSGSTAIGVFQNGGLLTVNGGHFTDSSFVTVGFSNLITGTANVTNGGTASDTTLTVGHAAGSIGNVLVSGAGSQWSNSGFVTVGESGTGGLTVSAGGQFTSAGGSVAANGGSSGTVLVTGAGSKWSDSGALAVGSGGSLTAQTGGTVSLTGGIFSNSGSVTVGAGGTVNGVGAYNQAAGSTTVAGALTSTSYTQTAGTTTVQSGGTLTTGSDTQNGGITQINVGGSVSTTTFAASGGTTEVDGTLGASGGVTVNSGGSLFGTGLITGDVSNGGVMFGGDSLNAPGLLSETGNYSETGGGAYDENIQSLVSNSDFAISGSDTLTGALNIKLLSGYTPNVNDTFVIMTFHTESGAFSTETVNGVSGLNINANEAFTIIYDHVLDNVTLKVISTGGGGPPVVPEPGSLLLLGSGLLGLASGVRGRLRRRANGSRSW
jgi:fibronectin-binding autotransporter adhesin